MAGAVILIPSPARFGQGRGVRLMDLEMLAGHLWGKRQPA